LEQGLRLPIVYNCGGYESLAVLRLLDGIVDIYMPDAKYGDNSAGEQLSGVADYWDRCREALAEMHHQVGDLQTDADGIATRGLLVRHLVLPEEMAKTAAVMRFLASLSPDTYVNVMAQYRPEHRARSPSCSGRSRAASTPASARSSPLPNSSCRGWDGRRSSGLPTPGASRLRPRLGREER